MIYETMEDKVREEDVAAQFALRWKLTQRKVEGDLVVVDRVLYRGDKLYAYFEVKCRNNPHDKYAEYMIDADKLERGLFIAGYDGVSFLLVVRFTDGIFWVKVTQELLAVQRSGGRKDRGDPNDIDRCAFFPVTNFRRLE